MYEHAKMTHLAGIHGNDAWQLEVLLSDPHALSFAGKLALAHLPALLVLDGTEHPESPVLPCIHTYASLMPCVGQASAGSALAA